MGSIKFKTLLRSQFDRNVQFAHDGKSFTCYDMFSKTVKIVDLDSAKDLMSFVEPEGSLQCLALSDDGKFLATATIGPNMVVLWDRESGKRLKEARWTIADSLCFSPDSRHLVIGGHDGTLQVRASEDLDSCYTLGSHAEGHSKDVRGVAFTKDGNQVISISQNGTVKIWDFNNKAEIKTIPMDCPKALSISEDGSTFSVGCDDGFVRVFGVPSWAPIREIKVSDKMVFRVALNCNGSLVAASKSVGDVDSLAIFSVKNGELVSNGSGQVNCISFHPADPGTLLTGYSAYEEEGEVRLWSTSGASAKTQEQPQGRSSHRLIFIGLGVAAIVIVGVVLALRRGTVPADITLITSDRTDLDCAAAASVEPYHCGYIDEKVAWKGEEGKKLRPYMTLDRHMYLLPGLFDQAALQERYKAEPPVGKARDDLKRFTAKCNLKVVGKLGGVRVRWVSSEAWSNPQDVEVATVVDCKVDG